MTSNKIISIALADDYPIFRKGLRLAINSFSNCAVDIEAGNGVELMNILEARNCLPDICLLDISMPEMDGYETLKHIKTRFPQIKVIMLSMHYNEYATIKCFRDGANSFLQKETDVEELHFAINKVFERGLYYTEIVNHHINDTLHNKGINTNLTENDIKFLRLSCTDMTYKEIADEMGLSQRTIDGYRDKLFERFKVSSRSALVALTISSGIKKIDNSEKT